MFQSTRPRGARLSATSLSKYSASFNPRARAGRDQRHGPIRMYGAFQSTRPRGARPVILCIAGCPKCFNPRARAGRDARYCDATANLTVSIHAPARGATGAVGDRGIHKLFQSTRPRGARQVVGEVDPEKKPFQSTRPRGARQGSIRPLPIVPGFNPRARAGRDSI